MLFTFVQRRLNLYYRALSLAALMIQAKIDRRAHTRHHTTQRDSSPRKKKPQRTIENTIASAREEAQIAMRVASLPIVRANCLIRSAALFKSLTKKGYNAELCIGVRAEDVGIEAHAWIEIDGISLDERSQLFAAFDGLPDTLVWSK